MITTVGEAQIIVRANTSDVKADLAATDVGADGALASKADSVGEDAGSALSSGFGRGAKDIGKDAEKDAEESTGRIKGLYNDLNKKASSSLSNLGVPASLLSGNKLAVLGIAAVGVAAVKLGADMQKANASIASDEGITVKAATDVGNAFLDTGGKVEFSGIKQAQAFSQVAGELKATQGQALTTAQSMTFMSSATDLATASGEDLNSTTTTLAGVMQAFQLPISESAEAAQTLFNASRDTGVGLDTLSSSVERVKARLGDLSPPLKDLSALMVDLTNNGITGRGATTALQGAYTALAGAATGTSKTNETAKETLKEYGVAVTNAKGQLTPMSDIITKLAPKFATMTQQQQLQTATLIFGASAAKQMTAVIDAGTASYTKATTAVNQNNTVTKAAAINQGTLSGQLHVLSAAVSDDGTKLGSVLIPALTDVAKAIVPVITGFTDVVGWFVKGGTAARVIEVVIAGVLTPALVKMGAEATVSAAKSILAFVTMSTGATTAATTIEADMTAASGSVGEFAAATTAADTEVATAATGMEASFAAIASSAGLAAAGIGSYLATSALLKTSVGKKVGNVLTAGGEYNPINELAGLLGTIEGKNLTGSGTTGSNTAALTKRNEEIIKAGKDKRGIETRPGETAAKTKPKDAYIAPPNTAAEKAAAEALKKAKEAAAKAAKDTGDALVKAQTDLTSEVVTAIKEPLAKGVEQLKALGVPANKATQVLKDSVKPFTDAVTALEKAGFTAAEAVKIADAGQAELTKEAKASAAKTAAAVKAATAASAASLTALTVNGIQVSGSIYRAAIGAAYKVQTGANLNATGNVSSVTPPIVSAPIAPAPTQSLSRGVVFESGAIQIHPAPGNDAASLAATKSYVDQMLRQLAAELRSGVSASTVLR